MHLISIGTSYPGRPRDVLKNTTTYVKDKEDVKKSDDVTPRQIFNIFYGVDSEQQKFDSLESYRDIRDLFH